MRRCKNKILISVLSTIFIYTLITHCVSCATPKTSLSNSNTETKGLAMIQSWNYPETKKIPFNVTLHEKNIEDPYQWLEDENNVDVQSWADAQDAFTHQYLKGLPGREELKKRLNQVLRLDSISTPIRRGDRLFYSRRKADAEKRIYYWRDLNDDKEHVLLDPNTLSTDGTIAVGVVVPSWDGKSVAYGLKENNADDATLHVMDVGTGKVSDVDVIKGARYARPQWLPNGRGFYYVGLPEVGKELVTALPGKAEIKFHQLGTTSNNDIVIQKATDDPKIFTSVELSEDGEWLFYYKSHGWNSNDVYYVNVKDPEKVIDPNGLQWIPLVTGRKNLYDVRVWKGYAYVMTNEGAPRYRILRHPLRDGVTFEPSSWETVVPEPGERGVIDNFWIAGDHLLIQSLENVTSHLERRNLDGSDPQAIALEGLGSIGRVRANPHYNTFYYSFETMLIPPTIYEASISTLKTKEYFSLKVPVDPSKFEVRQVFFSSKDGTKIPMFIVTQKNAPLNGKSPLILGGYGGFSVSENPDFRGSMYPWLEMGGSYAIVNLRGGGEFGTQWHNSGKLEKKQNVFDDFEYASRYLIDHKYTSADRLAIMGGSNGGLLVGAAMTQNPTLYAAVICAVPLLDMIRYTKYGAGMTWIPEYGDPEKSNDFNVLYDYSPYHHLQKGEKYPALLMMSADHDDRVDPMHARKFVAKLQEVSGSGKPALLRIERNAGHGGSDQISKYIDGRVDVFSFLWSQLPHGE